MMSSLCFHFDIKCESDSLRWLWTLAVLHPEGAEYPHFWIEINLYKNSWKKMLLVQHLKPLLLWCAGSSKPFEIWLLYPWVGSQVEKKLLSFTNLARAWRKGNIWFLPFGRRQLPVCFLYELSMQNASTSDLCTNPAKTPPRNWHFHWAEHKWGTEQFLNGYRQKI